MTEKAKSMGMNNSTFANSNGWPAAGHRMSMKDLALLADRLIKDYPTYYPLFSQKEFMFDEKESQNRFNRNPLLGLGIGADGLKTGHTQEAGYGLVGSAKQGDRRIIFVLTGLQSSRARAEEAEKIVTWAFRQFVQKGVAKAGSVIAQADVWNGATETVGLAPAQDLSLLVPALAGDTLEASVTYKGPFEAPIAAGTPLGELIVSLDGLPETRIPLVAAEDVAKGGFLPRMRTATTALMRQFGSAEPAS